MIFVFILTILFIATLIKLGMYSVWIAVFYGGLKIALFSDYGSFCPNYFAASIWQQ